MKRALLVLAATLALWLVTLVGCTVENQAVMASDKKSTPIAPIEGAIWIQELPINGTFDALTEVVHNGGEGIGGIMVWTENTSINNAPRATTLPDGGGWIVGEHYAVTNNEGIINVWLLPQGGGQ